MNSFFVYLSKGLYIYLIAGVLAGLSISLFIILNTQKNASKTVLERINANLSIASAVREEDEALRKKIAQLKSFIPQNYMIRKKEILILEKLDEIKDKFPTYQLIVTEFKTEGDIFSMGFTAQGFIENYTEFVNKIALLENPGFPLLLIDKIVINIEPNGSNSVQISGNIKALNIREDNIFKRDGDDKR